MTISSPILALLAGILSILSPCVLPILPIVLGTAASAHRRGPLALAAGLSVSFAVVGLFLATVGYSIGLDADRLRYVAAALMLIVGTILLLPPLQARLAAAAGPIGNWADARLVTGRTHGLAGQFWIGGLLGVVWSPCVGPTLGAASLLAAQGRDLVQVAVTMLAFGIGAALPLLGLGWLSRQTMLRWRGALLSAGSGMKSAIGLIFVIVSSLIMSGEDKMLEAVLVDASPAWLTNLTTSF